MHISQLQVFYCPPLNLDINNNKHIYLQHHRVGFTYTVIYKQTKIQGNKMRRNVIRKVIHTATQRDTQSDTYFHLLYKAAVFFVCLSVCLYPPFFRHDRRTATKFGTHIRVDMGLILS